MTVRAIGLWLAGFTLVADQASKWLAMQELAGQGIILVEGFFDLVLVHNTGAAFGMLANQPPLLREGFLVTVAVVAAILILRMLGQVGHLMEGAGLGMVLGGAIGNLVDRLRFGWVVDFLHVHWHDLSWPVFNLADSAITVGVAILLWINIFHPSAREGQP